MLSLNYNSEEANKILTEIVLSNELTQFLFKDNNVKNLGELTYVFNRHIREVLQDENQFALAKQKYGKLPRANELYSNYMRRRNEKTKQAYHRIKKDFTTRQTLIQKKKRLEIMVDQLKKGSLKQRNKLNQMQKQIEILNKKIEDIPLESPLPPLSAIVKSSRRSKSVEMRRSQNHVKHEANRPIPKKDSYIYFRHIMPLINHNDGYTSLNGINIVGEVAEQSNENLCFECAEDCYPPPLGYYKKYNLQSLFKNWSLHLANTRYATNKIIIDGSNMDDILWADSFEDDDFDDEEVQ